MGKTAYLSCLEPLLKRNNFALTILSSDKIRGEEIEDYKRNHSDASDQEAFENTGSKATKTFFNELKRAVKKSSKTPKMILYLDKNHPPNAISRTIETI